MIFALMEVHSSCSTWLVGPVTTRSSPCASPELLWPSRRNGFFELCPHEHPHFQRLFCQSLSQLLAASRAPYMLFLKSSSLPTTLFLDLLLVNIKSAGLCAMTWNYVVPIYGHDYALLSRKCCLHCLQGRCLQRRRAREQLWPVTTSVLTCDKC